MSKNFYNLSKPMLVEHAITNKEAVLSSTGSLITNTNKYTGRSPNDKFTVLDEDTEKHVWYNDYNKRFSKNDADKLLEKVQKYLDERSCYIVDCLAGARKDQAIKIRLIAQRAWHAMFAQNMFIEMKKEDEDRSIDFTIYHAPGFLAQKEIDHTNSEVAIIVNYEKKYILICGTEYAGEMKKSVFSVLNYLLPKKGILGMHCSANKNNDGHVAIFFGLSGTGKTTLSAEKSRDLIGDDEHAWDDEGIFNFEGGCYAKVINLSSEDEPEIYNAIQRFGAILENVGFDEKTRIIDLNDDSKTENTRASYDLSFIPHAALDKKGGHPEHIFMLTCDAFGVLPPIAKLSEAEAAYHFLNGYTAKVAGTERGIKEPKAVFSPCFGAPFMSHFPQVYAKLLYEKIKKHKVACWLLNTGWSGGPYGEGDRFKISISRKLISEALNGSLEKCDFYQDEYFGLMIPKSVIGLPKEIFYPKETWKDKDAYDRQAKKLARLFHENFKAYEEYVGDEIKKAGFKMK